MYDELAEIARTDHPEISTYPKHLHNGSEENVEPSFISDDPHAALREFLHFVREKLAEHKIAPR